MEEKYINFVTIVNHEMYLDDDEDVYEVVEKLKNGSEVFDALRFDPVYHEATDIRKLNPSECKDIDTTIEVYIDDNLIWKNA